MIARIIGYLLLTAFSVYLVFSFVDIVKRIVNRIREKKSKGISSSSEDVDTNI